MGRSSLSSSVGSPDLVRRSCHSLDRLRSLPVAKVSRFQFFPRACCGLSRFVLSLSSVFLFSGYSNDHVSGFRTIARRLLEFMPQFRPASKDFSRPSTALPLTRLPWVFS